MTTNGTTVFTDGCSLNDGGRETKQRFKFKIKLNLHPRCFRELDMEVRRVGHPGQGLKEQLFLLLQENSTELYNRRLEITKGAKNKTKEYILYRNPPTVFHCLLSSTKLPAQLSFHFMHNLSLSLIHEFLFSLQVSFSKGKS